MAPGLSQRLPVDPQAVQIEYLTQEVQRLRDLNAQLMHIRPRFLAIDPKSDEATPFSHQAVRYELKLKVPDWPLLTGRAQLAMEYWEAPYARDAFEELVYRMHRSLTEKIKERRPEWLP